MSNFERIYFKTKQFMKKVILYSFLFWSFLSCKQQVKQETKPSTNNKVSQKTKKKEIQQKIKQYAKDKAICQS